MGIGLYYLDWICLNIEFVVWGVGVLHLWGVVFGLISSGLDTVWVLVCGFMSFNCCCLVIGDWNCFGVLSVYTSFESVFVERGLRVLVYCLCYCVLCFVLSCWVGFSVWCVFFLCCFGWNVVA